MTVELGVLLNVALTLAGSLAAMLGARRAARAAAAEEGKNSGVIFTDLAYIKATLNEIKEVQKHHGSRALEMAVQVAMLQRDIKAVAQRAEENKQEILRMKG